MMNLMIIEKSLRIAGKCTFFSDFTSKYAFLSVSGVTKVDWGVVGRLEN